MYTRRSVHASIVVAGRRNSHQLPEHFEAAGFRGLGCSGREEG